MKLEIKEIYLIWDSDRGVIDSLIARLVNGELKTFSDIDMELLAKRTSESTMEGRDFSEKIDKEKIISELISDLELETNMTNGLSDYMTDLENVYVFSEENEGVFCYYKSQEIDISKIEGEERYINDDSGNILAEVAEKLYEIEHDEWEMVIEETNAVIANEDNGSDIESE